MAVDDYFLGMATGGALALAAVNIMEIHSSDGCNSFSSKTRSASGDFYQVATDQKLVTEEELLEACVEAANEKTETAVKAWVDSQPAPAGSPSPSP